MTSQVNFLQSLGWAVLNSLWQLALLWVIYQVITGIFKISTSSFKASLASSLLMAGFAWFLYTFISAYINPVENTVVSAAFVSTSGNRAVNDWLKQALPAASILYLVLLVLPLLHFIRNYRYVQVIRRYGLTKINVEWRMFVGRVAGQMNIRKKVQIWVSEFVSSPVTIGFLKPVILVPLAAINHLSPQQLEAVLLHELSHIKRFDYLVNLVINFIQTILYFNPFVKAFVKIVEKERERSCDEMVLQFQYDSHEYASALLVLEKSHYTEKPLALAASGKKNDLLQRVELIMGVHKKPVFSFNRLGGLMAGLLCIIVLNAFLLLSKPSSGHRTSSFTSFASSFDFMDDEVPKTNATPAAAPTEQPAQIVNHSGEDKKMTAAVSSLASNVSKSFHNNPAFINVSYQPVAVPVVLSKQEEAQVKEAMEASKKILKNIQWKVVEKSIADVFSQDEKEEIKASYEKEINKIDWKKWETNLKQAYDEIDWDRINTQLSAAVNQVRIDSIQMVYNKTLRKFDRVRKELKQNNLEGIPDSDITLAELEQKEADVQKALNQLISTRNKKIVHL